MANYHNVIVTINAAALAAQIADKVIQPGTLKQPLLIQPYDKSGIYIRAMTATGQCDNVKGETLTLPAPDGNMVIYQMTSIDKTYSSFIYGGKIDQSDAIAGPWAFNFKWQQYMPDNNGLLGSYQRNCYQVLTLPVAPWNKTYFHLLFQVIMADGTSLGYYTWPLPLEMISDRKRNK